MDVRPVLMVCGLLVSGLGLSMIIPALIDLYDGNQDWQVFAAAALVTLFAGSLLTLTNRIAFTRLTIRQAAVLTVVSWSALVFFGALPFLFSRASLGLADAIFESMSGLTTTGATVITGLDNRPPGVLMWRAILNGIGGIGIVVMAIAILPFLRVGGMQVFRLESSEKSDKVRARMVQMTTAIITVYILLIGLCAGALGVAGMSAFDAVAHALSAIATGGFSTKDASLGFYNNAAYDWILVVSMTAGALPLTWYVRMFGTRGQRQLRDSQVITFLITLLTCVVIMTIWLYVTSDNSWVHALRLAAFNVTSIVTDTGFVSTDYSAWGHFAIAAFILFSFIGGCTGSTAGAIKILRWQILFRYLRHYAVLIFQPHRTLALRYQGQTYDIELVLSVVLFVAAYLIIFFILTLLVALTGVDFLSSVSGVAACMANSGPGLGPIVGPAGTYQPLPDLAKWLLSLAMLLGRLEIFTVLVLLTPDFWRD